MASWRSVSRDHALTDPGLVLGRGDYVGEENGHAKNIALRPAAGTGQELLDLVDQGVDVAGEEQVVVAGEYDQMGIWDVFGQVLTPAQSDVTVVLAMQDKSGT